MGRKLYPLIKPPVNLGHGRWIISHMKELYEYVSSYMMTSSNGHISAVLALCVGNSPVTGEFLSQKPVTRSFDVCFDLRLNKRLSKPSRWRWFETPSPSLTMEAKGVPDYPEQRGGWVKHIQRIMHKISTLFILVVVRTGTCLLISSMIT